ncbi:MAG: hypothetical protein ACRDDY_04810 [Clostridium sp.]|uniref:hypothetical protein n=1 Tax=Clostridium sp. TaxID=1506 RepID=UPI003EE5ABE4
MKLKFDNYCKYLIEQYNIRNEEKYKLVWGENIISEFSISAESLNKDLCNTRLNFSKKELQKNNVDSLESLANYMGIDFDKFIAKIVNEGFIKPQSDTRGKSLIPVYYYTIKEMENEYSEKVKVKEVTEVTESFNKCIFYAIISYKKELKGFDNKLNIIRKALFVCIVLGILNLGLIQQSMNNTNIVSTTQRQSMLPYFSMIILVIVIIVLYLLSKNYKETE